MKTNTEDVYNSQASLYKSQTKDFKFPAGMFEAFISNLSWKKVLDIGCAYGRDVARLRELWFEAYWIDESESLIELSHRDIRKYLSILDMKNLNRVYKKSSFDGVISSASIVHMSHSEWIQILTDTYDILQDAWVLFLEDILREIGFDIIKTHTWTPQTDCWKILIAKK